MRPRSLSTALVAGTLIAATALAGAMSGPATAAARPLSPAHRGTPVEPSHAGRTVVDDARPPQPPACYTQLPDTTGNSVSSQSYGGSLYDDQAADDFTLTAPCLVTSVDVPGVYYNGQGPVVRVQVQFFSDAGGTPGLVGATRVTPSGAAGFADNPPGTFHIPLSTPVYLAAGVTYWISVQAVIASPGQWGWDTALQVGNPAMWQNPNGGYGFCQMWTPLIICEGLNSDMAFSLNPGTPTVCYAQGPASLEAINSQQSSALNTDIGADDLLLTTACQARSIDVPGKYQIGGPASQVRVRFYHDSSGVPVGPVVTRLVSSNAFGFSDTSGAFHIPLNPFVGLSAGTRYWVSVQALGVGGPKRWFWYDTPQTGYPAVWRNPGNGSGLNCPVWSVMQTCQGSANADFAFSVNSTP